MSDTQTKHILVVDDDKRLRHLLEKYLSEHGHRVSVAVDADEARQYLTQVTFDLLIVDVMMPGENGLSLTRNLRRYLDVPVLMLTAMGETEDRISGLETGADDYLTKPFEPRELLLRIQNILRRSHPPEETASHLLTFGELSYDMENQQLFHGQERIRLSPAEAGLMQTLTEKPGEIFTREELGEKTSTGDNPRNIDVQITRLRKKIETDPKAPRHLHTVRGRGYKLVPD